MGFDDFLYIRKAFRNEQMSDNVINVQRFNEQGGACFKLFGAAFGFFGFGQNIDVPAGQL